MSEASLKYSTLHHRLVLDRQTSEKVGHLSQLLLDSPSQKIVGFYCGGGLLGGSRHTFRWDQIDSIGDDSILVSGPHWELDTKGSGPVKAPIGHEIWTDSGNQIGKVVDLFFDPSTGAVVHYIFSSKGWQGVVGGTYQLPPIAVSSIGSKRIMTLQNMASHIQQHTEGLGQKAEHIAEFLKADYEQTKDDLASIKQTTQSAVEKVKEVLPTSSHETDQDQ